MRSFFLVITRWGKDGVEMFFLSGFLSFLNFIVSGFWSLAQNQSNPVFATHPYFVTVIATDKVPKDGSLVCLAFLFEI